MASSPLKLAVILVLANVGAAFAQEAPPLILNEFQIPVVISPNEVMLLPGQSGQPLAYSADGLFVLPETGNPLPVIVPPVPHTPVRRTGKPKLVHPLPKEYESRDKNGDGQIGMYEWDRTKYAEFAKLDTNGDGFLTAKELGAKGKSVMARVRIGGPDKEALPNPGNLSAYNQKIGETFAFSVTGSAAGSIWGTGTYTTDSSLATVAVHAGVLKDGESGTVRVTIVESPSQFSGSAANGVTSQSWQAFPAAYTVR